MLANDPLVAGQGMGRQSRTGNRGSRLACDAFAAEGTLALPRVATGSRVPGAIFPPLFAATGLSARLRCL